MEQERVWSETTSKLLNVTACPVWVQSLSFLFNVLQMPSYRVTSGTTILESTALLRQKGGKEKEKRQKKYKMGGAKDKLPEKLQVSTTGTLMQYWLFANFTSLWHTNY